MKSLRSPSGQTLEIALPLDPGTDCAEDVSHLVSRFLREIDACGDERAVSPADVLQALCITSAVHVARSEAQRRSRQAFSLPFIGARLSAASQGQAVA